MTRRKKKQSQLGSEIVQAMQKLVLNPTTARPKRKKKRGPRNKRPINNLGSDEVHISRRELLAVVTITSKEGSGATPMSHISLSFLKGIGASFDKFRWNRVSIFYKPAVGTTVGGLVGYGVDWDSNTGVVNRSAISGYTPNASCAVWADTESRPMVVPSSRLQTRQWYLANRSTADDIDKYPFLFKWAVTAEKAGTYGEFWVDYSVTMSGTNPA